MLKEKDFTDGLVGEAISWRRLEIRLQHDEQELIKDGNAQALRIMQHEIQYMPPAKKRHYMK